MSLDKLKLLVEEHRKDDPAVAPWQDQAPAEPLYIQEQKERAARLGKTVAEVRAHDEAFLADNHYPSPDCLKADEILGITLPGQSLPPARKAHFDSCQYCQALAVFSRLDEARIEEMSRILAKEPEPAQPKQQSWARVVAGVAVPIRDLAAAAAVLLFIVLPLSQSARLGVSNFLAKPSNTVMPQEDRLMLEAYRSSQQGDDGQAIRRTNEVLKTDPDNIDALLLRGKSWQTLGHWDKARQDFRAVLEIDPQNKAASEKLLSYKVAE